ncbi:hypothetical protein TNCV_4498341 [Trichonephila clavipes]|nr:hypothetical protein TNCV_4498341 [Trichonephila clavipes]
MALGDGPRHLELWPSVEKDAQDAAARLISRYSKFYRWRGVEVQRKRCRLRCRPRHLTVVQNDVVRRQKSSCS